MVTIPVVYGMDCKDPALEKTEALGRVWQICNVREDACSCSAESVKACAVSFHRPALFLVQLWLSYMWAVSCVQSAGSFIDKVLLRNEMMTSTNSHRDRKRLEDEEREGVKEKRMWPTVQRWLEGSGALCLIIAPAVSWPRQKCYSGFHRAGYWQIQTRVCALTLFRVSLGVQSIALVDFKNLWMRDETCCVKLLGTYRCGGCFENLWGWLEQRGERSRKTQLTTSVKYLLC